MPVPANGMREIETAAVEEDDTPAAVSISAPGRTRRRRWTWAVVTGALVVGCGGITLVALRQPAAPRPSASTTPAAALTTYTDVEKHFRISFPKSWGRTTEPKGGVVLHVSGRSAVSVHEFALAQQVNTKNVSDMRAVTSAILSTPDARLNVLTSRVVRIGRLTGLYYLYSFPSGKQEGVHAHYFLFNGSRMYTLVFQALPATDFQALAKTFDAVAESFVTTPSA